MEPVTITPTFAHLPSTFHCPRRTHQVAWHKKCRRAKLSPQHATIVGTCLAEIISAATCHTLSVSPSPRLRRCPERGARRARGQRLPRGAHPRAHTRPRSASPSRAAWGACVCARGRGGGEPARARPLLALRALLLLSKVEDALCSLHRTLSCPHPVGAVRGMCGAFKGSLHPPHTHTLGTFPM